MKQGLSEKIKSLQALRRDIKNKRLIFDDSRTNFGHSEMDLMGRTQTLDPEASPEEEEVKGFPYKLDLKKGGQVCLKLIPLESRFDRELHPSYIEGIILKELTENLINPGVCPHICSYLGVRTISNGCRALRENKILRRLDNEGIINNKSVILISEFVSGGNLNQWVYESNQEGKAGISNIQWKYLVFQMIYTIDILQKKYKMMHNDFHYGNILIDDQIAPGGYIVYTIGEDVFYLKNTGIIPKLWDFEFSMSYNDACKEMYPNVLVLYNQPCNKKTHTVLEPEIEEGDGNVPYNYVEGYDLHFFLTTLLELFISQELFDWILSLYPRELIPEDTTDISVSASENPETSTTDITDKSSDAVTDDSSLINGLTLLSISDSTTLVTDSTTLVTDSTNTESSSEDLLIHRRLKNGVASLYKLPNVTLLLSDAFFSELKIAPVDYDPECPQNIYCKEIR
jgi:hypothetical protein